MIFQQAVDRAHADVQQFVYTPAFCDRSQGGDVTHFEKSVEVDELAQPFKRLMRPRMAEYQERVMFETRRNNTFDAQEARLGRLVELRERGGSAHDGQFGRRCSSTRNDRPG